MSDRKTTPFIRGTTLEIERRARELQTVINADIQSAADPKTIDDIVHELLVAPQNATDGVEPTGASDDETKSRIRKLLQAFLFPGNLANRLQTDVAARKAGGNGSASNDAATLDEQTATCKRLQVWSPANQGLLATRRSLRRLVGH